MFCLMDGRVACVSESYSPKIEDLKLCNVTKCPLKRLTEDNKRLRGEVKRLGEALK